MHQTRETVRQQSSEIVEALERANPSRETLRKAEFDSMTRYGRARGMWYAKMFSAARRGVEFTRPEPEPSQFQPRIRARA